MSIFFLKWNLNSSAEREEEEEEGGKEGGSGDVWREEKELSSCVRPWMNRCTMKLQCGCWGCTMILFYTSSLELKVEDNHRSL